MALVRKFDEEVKVQTRGGISDVVGSYRQELIDGERFLVLRSWGAGDPSRASNAKQVLHVDRGAAEQLAHLLRTTFPDLDVP